MTVAEPGVHGAGVSGTHGIGVNAPMAAAVAEATVGFAKLLHIPKVAIFMGLLSMIVAAGNLPARTLLSGVTIKGQGANPKGHLSVAVATTS